MTDMVERVRDGVIGWRKNKRQKSRGKGNKQGERMTPPHKFLVGPHLYITIFDNSGWLSAREQVRDNFAILILREMWSGERGR